MGIPSGKIDYSPKRIAIVGPESSGKTTLSKELTNHYSATCVEEYARQYLAHKKEGYIQSELDFMLQQQLQNEITAMQKDAPYLFCDTNALSFYIWSMVKYGSVSNYILAKTQKMNYDLYLLCRPDLPYKYDPLRENPSQKDRQVIFDLHLKLLKKVKRPFYIVENVGDERIEKVISFLQNQFPA